MSIKEQIPAAKPASQMTPEEWEAHKRWVNEQLQAQGKEPIDWSRWRQPRPMSEADRKRAVAVFERLGKLPR